MNDQRLKKMAQKEQERQAGFQRRIFCCTSTACLSAGAGLTRTALDQAVAACDCDEDDVEVVPTGCMGLCSRGPLVRSANRRLRAAIMMTADCLLKCNDVFRAKSALWRQLGKDPRHAHVKVASRFCRIAFQMVADGQVFSHPSCRNRDYIVQKLMRFHLQHGTPAAQTLRDLQQAARQVPSRERPREAEPLAREKQRRAAGGRGPQPIGEIIGQVLAELTGRVQSEASGDVGLS